MRLTPTSVLNDAVPALLAADAATLAPAVNANHVHLIKIPFTPETYTFNPADVATYTGSAAKSAGTGAQQSFKDPVTGNEIVQLLEPAGGWTWKCTVAPGAPETIYGVCVTDNADAVTLGSGLLEEGPVTIAAVNDAVVVGDIQLQLPPGFMG